MAYRPKSWGEWVDARIARRKRRELFGSIGQDTYRQAMLSAQQGQDLAASAPDHDFYRAQNMQGWFKPQCGA